jgi:hypothetical protein
MVCEGLGREVPTYEAFDGTIFARIYETMQRYRTHHLTTEAMDALWEPLTVEVQQMCGVPVAPPPRSPPRNVIVIDTVDEDIAMGENSENSSDSEIGSGVNSEEGSNEGGTGGTQGDDEVAAVQSDG